MVDFREKNIFKTGTTYMRILFLCNKSPWPPKEGGPMAMNMLIEGVIDAGNEVKVLAVNSFKYHVSADGIPSDYVHKTGIELIEVDLRMKPLDAFLNLFTGNSYHVERFVSESFRKKLIKTLESGGFDVVQLETLFMCPYIETIRKYSQARIVLRAHNIEHLIWQRIAEDTANPLKRWYLAHLARTLKRYEEKIIFKVDGIMAIAPKDAAYFKDLTSAFVHSGNSCIPVIDLPFGIDPARYNNIPGKVEFPSLFSLGAMNWIPNQEGIRWFLQKVWPDVHNEFPGLKYYLAGREMPEWMRNLNLPDVIVLGEVGDAREFLASKAIMIVPLFSGSGIRVKIIEGMAAGKTIISTSIGAEGISYTHRENILIADEPCDFFEMISLCVSDPSFCLKTGNKARALVETDYNARLLIKKLAAFYQQLPG
jgi:polysaccharide biosynthesis protein PslH